jgi:hypothetical protein
MNTSKIHNINAKDPIDILIFEKGLRIKKLIIDKELDLLGVILNNGKILEDCLSAYPRLKDASQYELENWQLIGKGIGVTWESLNEDLSVKGFIQSVALKQMIEHLQPVDKIERATA